MTVSTLAVSSASAGKTGSASQMANPTHRTRGSSGGPSLNDRTASSLEYQASLCEARATEAPLHLVRHRPRNGDSLPGCTLLPYTVQSNRCNIQNPGTGPRPIRWLAVVHPRAHVVCILRPHRRVAQL